MPGQRTRGIWQQTVQRFDLIGIDHQKLGQHKLGIDIRQLDDQAIVECCDMDIDAGAFACEFLDHQAPGLQHGSAELAVHADAPIADLVAKPLHHNGAIGGQLAGGLPLLVEIGHQILACQVVQSLIGQLNQCLLVSGLSQFPHPGANGTAEFGRAGRRVAAPEGQSSGTARRW